MLFEQPMYIEVVATEYFAEASTKEIVSCAKINVDDLTCSSICLSLQQINSHRSLVNVLLDPNYLQINQYHTLDTFVKKMVCT